VVDVHFAARKRVSSLREQLVKQAMLFRTIQKQLLIKFRVGEVCVCGIPGYKL
jgi:hypothetical protein